MSDELQKYDVIVIGGGPGGYPAAIRAAQNGKKVALVEAGKMGGTCLNRGCIPSKALISCSKALHHIRQAEELGIHVENVSYDFKKMVQRKDLVVSKVKKGLEGLIKSNKITYLKGFGEFLSPKTIKVTGEDNCQIHGENIIIATGSEPKEMKAFPCDGKRIHNSTSILNIQEVPKKLVIIGSGIIGCEFASLFVEFGSEITMIEVLPRILPMECSSISSTLTKAYKKRGIKMLTNTLVESIKSKKDGIILTLSNGEKISADAALVATGRKLNTDKIGLDKAGVKVKESGMIEVDDKMETSIEGVFAVGDIASKWWLAHVASHQGIVAGNNVSGKPTMRMHYNAVPSVIFTNPEIGTVGYTLEEAINHGHKATLGSFPFQALGKSQASDETEGFAQIVTDKETGQVLGAQVVGYEAGTLVAEMGVVIANEMTIECVTHTIHAHPTIAEAWLEAAYIAQEEPLHMPPQKPKASV